jgi:hypothetical protein
VGDMDDKKGRIDLPTGGRLIFPDHYTPAWKIIVYYSRQFTHNEEAAVTKIAEKRIHHRRLVATLPHNLADGDWDSALKCFEEFLDR